MARAVYGRKKHCSTVEDLKEFIEEVWAAVGSELLLKLYESLARCMHALMDARDGGTKH